MRAAVLRGGQIVEDEVADPSPAPGQVLVKTLACGICGSDLHFRKHGREMVAMGDETDSMFAPDLDRDIVMGHEFTVEVMELGAGVEGIAIGTIATSVPVLFLGGTLEQPNMAALGFSNEYPGGYGEAMVLSPFLLQRVPNGLDPKLAALTEPMAVGLHGVNKSGIAAGAAALVIGCGPVGLSVIAALKAKGIETIIATDLSSARRALATTMGATHVTDPREQPGIDLWREVTGSKGRLFLYEAVGIPGMINQIMRDAPKGSVITVVGVCMENDTILPIVGINKELELKFVLGYDPFTEFAPTLIEIAEGRLDVAPLITGTVGIDGVAGAFDALADPEAHCKILVAPNG